MSSSSGVPASRSASVAPALAIAASILPRWRMIPASPSSRSTSRSPKRATRSGSKPAKAAAERLALAEDRDPREARLEPLEAETLVEAALVAHRAPPLLVVVGDVRAGRSSASSGSVRARHARIVANDSAGNSERRLRTRVAVRPGFLYPCTKAGEARPGKGRKRPVSANGSGKWLAIWVVARRVAAPVIPLLLGAAAMALLLDSGTVHLPADPGRCGFQRSAGRKGRRLPAGRPPDAPPGGRACETRAADARPLPGRRPPGASTHRRPRQAPLRSRPPPAGSLRCSRSRSRRSRRATGKTAAPPPPTAAAACAARCRRRARPSHRSIRSRRRRLTA